MTQAYIVDFVRTPFTPGFKGALAGVRPDDLIGQVVRELVERTGVDPAAIEDLILGCAFPEAEQGLNIGRTAVLLAGLPLSVAGATVNRWCGSSMQAVQMAWGGIATGAGDVFVAGGVESMSRVTMMGFNPMPNPAWDAGLRSAFLNMGLTAENVAARYGLSRRVQDEYAAMSQARAAEAQAQGRLADEIIAVAAGGATVASDGCIRGGTTVEKLGELKTVFKADGVVTAGNASPITDGAAAVLVCSEAALKRHGLKPKARIAGFAVSGCAPEIMGVGPVEATRKALSRAGIGADQLDVIEMNEAFAAQVLACCRDLDVAPERLNRDGGAIAIGHPLGATGARLVGKAASLLQRDGGRYALATQCIGGGQGIAMVLEAA
jgi:acetyl-CoA acyltransferase